MSKSAQKNNRNQLKASPDRSHNIDDRLIRLVRFMARRAAEDDFKTLQQRTRHHDNNGKEI